MTPYRDLTDHEWRRVVPLLPEMQPRTELRGRPLANTRAVLNGVLWVIYSGATWSAMPRRYPSYQTCHRRFKVLAGRKVALALIYADGDVGMAEFKTYFGEAGERLAAYPSATLTTIPDADHNFTHLGAGRRLLDALLRIVAP